MSAQPLLKVRNPFKKGDRYRLCQIELLTQEDDDAFYRLAEALESAAMHLREMQSTVYFGLKDQKKTAVYGGLNVTRERCDE
ncbi:MAG TPA: hypothetical protein VJH63_04545 [Candidatus Paceibacterota bacterium]